MMKLKFQWERKKLVYFILVNNLKFPEGNVIKYTSRHNQEGGGGKKDIEKAIHYLEMIKERDYE